MLDFEHKDVLFDKLFLTRIIDLVHYFMSKIIFYFLIGGIIF